MSRPRSNSPIESRKAFITEVKVRRAYLDMSQNDLGHILGISPARVSGLLSNPDELTVGRLRKIIQTLSLDPMIVLTFLGYDRKTIKRFLDSIGD